jgi:hypothetical protein
MVEAALAGAEREDLLLAIDRGACRGCHVCLLL